jgi:16S rRNA (adenine1518-N6/adenine1519-N6)-dimethyltransferase
LLGNLPYYASTQILVRALTDPTPITLALLMLQKEVAARLSAAPRSRDYGILTLVVQITMAVEYLRTVPPSVFLPQPEVESALVRLTPRAPNELPEHDRELFITLIRSRIRTASANNSPRCSRKRRAIGRWLRSRSVFR